MRPALESALLDVTLTVYQVQSHLALAAVTTSPARVAGLSHRVGLISVNKDADIVLWSSHPLSLGATPSQVIIDGIPQLTNPQALDLPTEKEYERRNGPEIASIPKSKHPLEEQDDGFDWEHKSERGKEWIEGVMFTGVKELFVNRGGDLVDLAEDKGVDGLVEVVVVGGKIVCVARDCSRGALAQAPSKVVDLKGGSLLPTFFAYGPALGLSDITSVRHCFSLALDLAIADSVRNDSGEIDFGCKSVRPSHSRRAISTSTEMGSRSSG